MKRHHTLADAQLFELLRQDDVLALSEINERYGELLYRLVYRKTGDTDTARDVVQQVMIKIWEKRKELELRGNLNAYLARAVHNESLNFLKQQARQQQIINDYQRFIDQKVPGADQALLDKDIMDALYKAIEMLPERVRAVMELRLKEHLSNKEISIRLDIAEETVKSHIKRGIISLKRIFFLYYLLLFAYACMEEGELAQKKNKNNFTSIAPSPVSELS